MLLAQILVVAFVVMLAARRLPSLKATVPTDVVPAAENGNEAKATAEKKSSQQAMPIAGTTSPWHFHLDRAQLPAILGFSAGLLALIPATSGVSLAMALRGLWGDPSITSLQLLVLVLMGRAPAALTEGWRAPAVVAIVAALFYPLALGATDFDPYRLGYTPALLVLPLAITAIVLWYRGQALWLWLLAIDLLAWSFGLLESPNLWDTLLDPLLALACLVLLARNGWRTFRKTHP